MHLLPPLENSTINREKTPSLFFFVRIQEKCVPLHQFLFEMKTLLIVIIAVAAVGLMMAGLGIKLLFRKEKEFRRPCANADPKTGRCEHCTCDLKNKK